MLDLDYVQFALTLFQILTHFLDLGFLELLGFDALDLCLQLYDSLLELIPLLRQLRDLNLFALIVLP